LRRSVSVANAWYQLFMVRGNLFYIAGGANRVSRRKTGHPILVVADRSNSVNIRLPAGRVTRQEGIFNHNSGRSLWNTFSYDTY
jgi:hypothetical protein